MAQMLASRGDRVRMCYAARDAGELVYRDALQAALGERLRTFRDDAGERLDLDAEIAALAPRAQLLACGPVPLLDAAARRMAARRASAGRPALRDFRQHRPPRSASLLGRAAAPRPAHRGAGRPQRCSTCSNEAGVETLYDCRRGECGLCAIDIVSVRGAVDHRDVFFSAAEKRENKRLCACVSRISGGGVVLDSSYRPDA